MQVLIKINSTLGCISHLFVKKSENNFVVKEQSLQQTTEKQLPDRASESQHVTLCKLTPAALLQASQGKLFKFSQSKNLPDDTTSALSF